MHNATRAVNKFHPTSLGSHFQPAEAFVDPAQHKSSQAQIHSPLSELLKLKLAQICKGQTQEKPEAGVLACVYISSLLTSYLCTGTTWKPHLHHQVGSQTLLTNSMGLQTGLYLHRRTLERED